MTSPSSWLSRVERLGNRLPHPTLLFVWLCILLLPLSAVLKLSGLEATHPVNGDTLAVRSLISGDGLRWILTSMVSNFTSFAPLGVVLVAMLGIGLAEQSGWLGALLRSLVHRTPDALLVPVIALAGVLSSLTTDAGYVVLIPLAALVFQQAGRSPLTGIAVAFAGVSGGFSANLLLGPIDALLAGISTAAAQTLDQNYEVHAAANYWFMLASTILVIVVITLVTRYCFINDDAPTHNDSEITENHSAAMRWSLVAATVYVLVIALLAIPEQAPLRHPDTGLLLSSPFMHGIVILIALGFALCGLVYGRISGRFRHGGQVIEAMETTMAQLSGYLVLMFFAAQFVAWFSWSGLALVLAVQGADALANAGMPPAVLMIGLVLLVGAINILVGSASAKWALLAPLLIPMLMLVGVAPEATQAAFRVGDSATNIITPLMPYFALVLGFVRRYRSDAGVGTLVAMMLPYSLWLLGGWTVLLALWLTLGLPLGPGNL